jgi:hypothetical protein
MDQNMCNHGTPSLAARLSCVREHHICNDSNASSNQVWALMEDGNAYKSNRQACLSRIGHGRMVKARNIAPDRL